MSREWKPGDVAAVTHLNGRISRSMLHEDGRWHCCDGGVGHTPTNDVIRPLAVIDPDDREQARSVYAAYVEAAGVTDNGYVNAMQVALRSLLAPPKPEEPTRWLAVVEDSDGVQWYRVSETAQPNTAAWAKKGQEYVGLVRIYADVAAVRVVSEGVTS